MISKNVLWSIRNELPMTVTVANLADKGGPVSKFSEGFFRFECPYCHDIRATVNPKNNLAHCFSCQKNFNNIDLMLSLGLDFRKAVSVLRKWLRIYQRKLPVVSEKSCTSH
jgi:DNA primase